MRRGRVAILGAGPAGLGAAWRLHVLEKAEAVVLERQADVGGNAGSFELAGLPVDYGSHRLHPACDPRILSDLRGLLGADLLDRPRHGRIRLRGRWIHFPLRPLDLALHLPPAFSLGVARDAARKLLGRAATGGAETFESVLARGLGATICRDFYFPYAEKIWGRPPAELSPIQARRRVSAGSLGRMARRVLSAVPGLRPPGAGRFFYPRQGYGQIARALAEAARGCGADVRLNSTVRRVTLGRPLSVEFEYAGRVETVEADRVWSTLPITLLARLIAPAAPRAILEASERIRYRAMVLFYVVLAQPRFTPFDAHYFPEAHIPLTRLSEPKNYAARYDPPDRTVLCGEFPCDVDDPVWRASPEELLGMLRETLASCGVPLFAAVIETAVRRLPCAYPIYLRGYEAHFDALDEWIGGLEGVLTFGRQGLFAHDNTHHALAMAYAAVDCLDADGSFDAQRWAAHRRAFESHVVED